MYKWGQSIYKWCTVSMVIHKQYTTIFRKQQQSVVFKGALIKSIRKSVALCCFHFKGCKIMQMIYLLFWHKAHPPVLLYKKYGRFLTFLSHVHGCPPLGWSKISIQALSFGQPPHSLWSAKARVPSLKHQYKLLWIYLYRHTNIDSL